MSKTVIQGSNVLNGELENLSDEEIAAELSKGLREDWFKELFERYEKRVYLWCFRYTHNVDDAVDLSQEVFLRLYRGIEGYEGQSSFSTWVYVITRNCCIDELNRKRNIWSKRMQPMDELDGARHEEWSSFFDMKRVESILEMARERMSAEELDAFVLHYRDALSVKEVTKVLGCRNATGARALIQSARRKFRKMVERLKDG